jgi:hypothetical protein
MLSLKCIIKNLCEEFMNYIYYMALYDLLAIIILALIEFNAFKRKKY